MAEFLWMNHQSWNIDVANELHVRSVPASIGGTLSHAHGHTHQKCDVATCPTSSISLSGSWYPLLGVQDWGCTKQSRFAQLFRNRIRICKTSIVHFCNLTYFSTMCWFQVNTHFAGTQQSKRSHGSVQHDFCNLMHHFGTRNGKSVTLVHHLFILLKSNLPHICHNLHHLRCAPVACFCHHHDSIMSIDMHAHFIVFKIWLQHIMI